MGSCRGLLPPRGTRDANGSASESSLCRIEKNIRLKTVRKKILIFLTGIAFATGMISASATAAGTSVATVPVGMITYPLAHGATTFLSLPLTNTEVYASSVSSVTDRTISVGDAPAPFATSFATPGSPYFVKFLTGNERGRVVLITSNTASALSLDTTDHATGTPVLLTATSFNVQVGDTFEIFPGDTLASIFGAGTAQSPLVLTGGTSLANSDIVCLFTSVNVPSANFYFNTTDGCWEEYGTTANANNTIIYPYSAFSITREYSHPDTALVLGGRVTAVAAETKVVSNGTIFTSSHYATDVKLSQLQFGANWATGADATSADTLSVWNAAAGHFDTYYQLPDSTWRKSGDAMTDQSSFAIGAGTVTTIAKREAVTGSATFLQSQMPYALD
jgi:uncharacterized protein (TIGR02597 family)